MASKKSSSRGSSQQRVRSTTPQQALGVACRAADIAGVRAALGVGADPNKVLRGWASVHALIQESVHGDGDDDEEQRAECLALLCSAGCDLGLRAGFPPAPPLVLAGLGGKRILADALIARGALVDVAAQAALGHRAPLSELLAREPNLATARDVAGLTLLHYAAGSRMGRTAETLAREVRVLVELLVASGAEVDAIATVNVHGKAELRPSTLAIAARRFDETRFLLEHGADATVALVSAMWNAKDEFARFGALCLEFGARPDAAWHEDRPLLNELVRWGQFAQAAWLLERGASPSRVDARGWTAVHQAASRGNANFWARILAHGGDPQVADLAGLTPAQLARTKGLAVPRKKT